MNLKNTALHALCSDYAQQVERTRVGRREFLASIDRIKSLYRKPVQARAVWGDAVALDENTVAEVDLERTQGEEDGGV